MSTKPEPSPTAPGKDDRITTDQASRKRFRIEKIEERIAPGGHYNPQSKWVGGSYPSGSASSGASIGGPSSIF